MTTWIFLAVLCVALALYIALPFFLNGARETAPQLSTATARRASLQNQRRELNLDRDTGKIDDAEFERLQMELTLEDSIVATRTAPRPAVPAIAETDEVDLEIEAEILIARARRSEAPAAPTEAETDAALEAEIARARTALKAEAPRVLASESGATWTCSCGREMSGADQFCAACGAARAGNLTA